MFCQTLHSTHTISICFGVGHGPSIKTLPKTNKTLKNNAWIRSHTFLLAQKLHLLGGSLAGFLLSGKCNSNFKNSPGFVRLHNVEDHFHNGQGQWVNGGVVVGEVDIFEMRVFLWNSGDVQYISLQEVLKPDEIDENHQNLSDSPWDHSEFKLPKKDDN